VNITDALLGVKVLGIETAPFIYYTESRPVYVDKMRAIFNRVLNDPLQVKVSTIILPECLMKPFQANDTALITAYEALFENTEEITLVPVDLPVARRSAHLRAKYNLKTPDALHVATAIESGCQAFLTNDLGVKRVTELRVLVLDELELDPAAGTP
jgi:predicted nucleic acid-binding protein